MSAGVYIHDQVAAVRALYTPLERYAGRGQSVRDQLAAQSQRLWEAWNARDPVARIQISNWHPDHIGPASQAALPHAFTLADARLTLAREHGFSDWEQVEVGALAPPYSPFEDAVDDALDGDLENLEARLAAEPELIERRSAYAHRASLIHYMAANGVETYRQVTPLNGDLVLQALVSHGADVNGVAAIYGDSRPLQLLLTSAHPREAGLTRRMAAVLRDAGAK